MILKPKKVSLLLYLFFGAMISLLSPAIAEETPIDGEKRSLSALGIGIPESDSGIDSALSIQTYSSLFIVIAILIGGYGILLQLKGGRRGAKFTSDLEIKSKVMLSPRTSLMLVNVRGRPYLCSVGSEQVNIIPVQNSATQSFDEILSNEGVKGDLLEEKKEIYNDSVENNKKLDSA